ncbi:hypothetical protein A8W25_00035 [Streptomyces sp. ERV7]|uniref:DUF3592 domain-containing protein n=1 Tax=Streptomyces sp. ERV7 TaxID=1322334 RepID=UPI0007F41292|nr:DUF3592 domain-containing protein [Streptomyces sp. ERV7]OAR26745.1 hypothetical protein A8W25_00035 [Streptomyces sp. ERV7]
MFAVGGVFGVVFGSVGLLFAAFGITMLVLGARKSAEYRRVLREGQFAEARCLETYVVHRHSTDGPSSSQRRLIVAFRTGDGREARAEVVSRHPYVAGDVVPVRYPPERPERAMAAEPTPGVGAVTCLLGGVMVLFTCVGLLFAAIGFGVAAFMGVS